MKDTEATAKFAIMDAIMFLGPMKLETPDDVERVATAVLGALKDPAFAKAFRELVGPTEGES